MTEHETMPKHRNQNPLLKVSGHEFNNFIFCIKGFAEIVELS